MSKGKSMSLNTDDLKKFEQGVPEKIFLSGSFDRNVPRNIRLMTSSAEYFRIDSAEKKLSVCLDWRCTLRKNIIEFIVVVVQATLLISIGNPEVGTKSGDLYLVCSAVCFASEDVDYRTCRSV